MKRIEYIEMMEPEQLEDAALKENIHVPEGLESSVLAAIVAKEAVRDSAPAKRSRWVAYTAIAAAAAFAVAFIMLPIGEHRLHDTYDDPYLAYAEIEATFQRIADKMAVGVHLSSKAGETAEKPIQIIKKITE